MTNKQTESDRINNDSKKKLRVINMGLLHFYDALIVQNASAIHLEWQPPVERSEEINDLLDKFL